jgi:hypothetical protein
VHLPVMSTHRSRWPLGLIGGRHSPPIRRFSDCSGGAPASALCGTQMASTLARQGSTILAIKR